MKKRTKKAAAIAAFGYFSVMSLGLGMLKAAQQTRRTLYGGTPVMAQVTHQTLPEDSAAQSAEISFGGGEWTVQLTAPKLSGAIDAAENLPPSMSRLLLRLAVFSDKAADYTAELITGAYESSFSF